MKKIFLRTSAALAGLLIPGVALAIPPNIWVFCGDLRALGGESLPGCSSGWGEYISGAINILLIRLPLYIYILGVLFIMIGGAYILLSAGDQEKVTKGKNAITWAVIGIFVMNFAVTLISYIVAEVSTRDSASDLVESVIYTLIGSIFDLLYIAILGVALFSGMRMVLAFGKEDEFKKARDGLFWCAVGAIIINLADAIATAIFTT